MADTDFLLISDPAIWAIPVQECYEPLVDVRELNIEISPARAFFYEGYIQVRQSVADKLQEAVQYLPAGMSFLFSEGHRPIELQKSMFAEYYTQLGAQYPDWDEQRLRNAAATFIAPPEDVPPHSTGGAIDITLLDERGAELDMGSALDELPDQSNNRNYTFSPHIPLHARANRKLLFDALSRVGFVNYPAEWWHWSYGDKYWAYHAKCPYAIYGSV